MIDKTIALEALEEGLQTGFGIALVAVVVCIVVMFLGDRK